MHESYDFNNRSINSKLNTTTELKINSYLSMIYKFQENDTYSTIEEDSKEINIENFVSIFSNNFSFNFANNLPLEEEESTEEQLLYHYSNSIKENNPNSILKQEKRKLFKVNYRYRFDDIFDKENVSLSQLSNEKTFLKNKALSTKKRRRENWDNIRKKIKTIFFNKYVYTKMNNALKNKKSKLYFVKFPITFVNDIKRNTNKDIVNISLLEIMLNKELYDEKDLNNYYHNLKVIENKEINENEELITILNKKYSELFEEYLNSIEFNINEMKRLKNNNMDKIYIEKYIYQSKNFIKYFAE